VIALKTDGGVVGMLSVDNLLSGRPVTGENVQALLPFAEQAAVAVRNARLLAERERLVERQRRFVEIAAAINSSLDLDTILRMVRDAAVEVGGFDRAGVWTMAQGVLHGSWGTDEEGMLRDERCFTIEVRDFDGGPADVFAGERNYAIQCERQVAVQHLGRAPSIERLQYAVTGLRAHGELVGVIFTDNLMSSRPIRESNVEGLLPFAEQAAAAIRNAQLLAERRDLAARQQRLAGLAAAISSRTELSDVLRMVRDAIVEVAGFDRAVVYMLDPHRQRLNGTWGTDREGRIEDLRHLTYPLRHHSDWPMWHVVYV